MQKIVVQLGARSYPVYLGSGLLADYRHWLNKAGSFSRLCLVSNPQVYQLYGSALTEQMQGDGLDVSEVIVQEGESHKSLEDAAHLYAELGRIRADRKTVLIAMGGGVVGDLCGFVAATYLRGIPLVHLPTTLLSQVDSSIGGKTAVNHGPLKNQIGVIYQPKVVVGDFNTLATLPPREIASGLAEIIKCAVIRDASLFGFLERHLNELLVCDTQALNTAAARAATIKAAFVSLDEHDRGPRALLNLGHTVGHGLESASDFKLSHGEAVSLGMLAAARISQMMHFMSPQDYSRLKNLLEEAGLPTCVRHCDVPRVLEAIQHDKKVASGRLHFILPIRIGHAVISERVDLEMIAGVLSEE
jgi:3-dehydroquinate synthase